MKSLFLCATATALVTAAALSGSASAQVAYGNSVLNGCYSYISSSVDTQKGALNVQKVGTMCFDGNGNVTDASGHYSNINGTVGNGSGGGEATYSTTNTPGDGMGTIDDKCTIYGFSVNGVDTNGLAHGFQFMLIQEIGGKKCNPEPNVIGGTAWYQGP